MTVQVMVLLLQCTSHTPSNGGWPRPLHNSNSSNSQNQACRCCSHHIRNSKSPRHRKAPVTVQVMVLGRAQVTVQVMVLVTAKPPRTKAGRATPQTSSGRILSSPQSNSRRRRIAPSSSHLGPLRSLLPRSTGSAPPCTSLGMHTRSVTPRIRRCYPSHLLLPGCCSCCG